MSKYEYLEIDVEDALVDHLRASGEYSHIWRQVPTQRGIVDVLGITTDGMVRVWEVKRDNITERDLVQMLAYVAAVENGVQQALNKYSPVWFPLDDHVMGYMVGKDLKQGFLTRYFYSFGFSFVKYELVDGGGFTFEEVQAYMSEDSVLEDEQGAWVNIAGEAVRRRIMSEKVKEAHTRLVNENFWPWTLFYEAVKNEIPRWTERIGSGAGLDDEHKPSFGENVIWRRDARD